MTGHGRFGSPRGSRPPVRLLAWVLAAVTISAGTRPAALASAPTQEPPTAAPATASGPALTPGPTSEPTPSPTPEPTPEPTPDLTDKSWRDIVEELTAEYDLSTGMVTIGYCNTVTGETEFYDPDRYMDAASMYKVPLAMAVADKLAARGYTIDDTVDGTTYGSLVRGMIVNSNNAYAEVLWNSLGGYMTYRRIIAPYMGEDPDTVDGKFYENNYFTARQMLACLSSLYEGREGAYGRIIELMKTAEPEKYFHRYETRYEIAHKYGYLPSSDHGGPWMNDCGIIYADDTYLLVCFTLGFREQDDFLGRLSVLMSDYTNFRRQQSAVPADGPA